MTLRPGLASLCLLILPQGRTLWANEAAWWGFASTRSHCDYSAHPSLFPVPIFKMAAAPPPGLYPSPKWPPAPPTPSPPGLRSTFPPPLPPELHPGRWLRGRWPRFPAIVRSGGGDHRAAPAAGQQLRGSRHRRSVSRRSAARDAPRVGGC